MKAIIIGIALAVPTLAHAAFCSPNAPRAPHNMMLQSLLEQYQEKVIDNATIRNGQAIIGLFEITAAESGTWTAIATGADGVSCIMAAGGDWSGVKTKPKGTRA